MTSIQSTYICAFVRQISDEQAFTEAGMRPQVPLERFEIFADGLDHPEGLAFDADGVLWAGGELGQVYRIRRNRRLELVTTLGGFNLGLTFSASQELFVCNSKKSALVHLDRKGCVLHSWETAGRYRFRTPNFSVFDGEGNLYFTDSGEWLCDDGHLFVLRSNGKIDTLLDSLAFPNGLALSTGDSTLYVVQSTKDNVLSIPVGGGARTGRPRVFARGLHRVPDGAALDAAGNLYVTCYASDNVYRVTPDGKVSLWACDSRGTMLARPTNIAFGGDRLDEMYFANLGRWHICRTRAGIKGQPLVNQR